MQENEHDDVQDDIEPTGETNIDEPDVEEIEAEQTDKIKTIKTKLKQCETEKMSYLEDLQRAKAEFLNTKRRLEEQLQREKERIVEDHIQKLLPLCDSFTMAMANQEVWQSVDENWRKGIEGIHNQLQSILTSYNVTVIDPLNESFSPERHEALGTEANDADTDTVIRVIQNGYERNGEIIRVAKVILSE